MPIFSYKCSYCGEEFERLVHPTATPPYCPECGKPTLQIWSTPAPAQWKCPKGSL